MRKLKQLLNGTETEQAFARTQIELLGTQEAEKKWLDTVERLLIAYTGEYEVREAESEALRILAVEASRARVTRSTVERPDLLWLAICGNPEVSPYEAERYAHSVIDATARAIALLQDDIHVTHGPRGAGIMAVNVAHNKYHANALMADVVYGDRRSIILPASIVVLIGGRVMTGMEADLAIAYNKRIFPINGSGGTADRYYRKILTGRGESLDPALKMLDPPLSPDDYFDWLKEVLRSEIASLKSGA